MFISWTLPTFTPIGITFGRSLLAAVVLSIACVVTRTRLPPVSVLPTLAVYACLVAVAPWTFLNLAVSHADTSLLAIVGSTTAIWVVVANLMFFREQRPSPLRMAGIFISFAGILVVIGVWNGLGAGTAIGIGAQLCGSILYALSIPFAHRYLTGGPHSASVPAIAISTAVFILASIVTLPLVLVFGGTQGPLVASSAVGILVMGVFVNGLVVVLTLHVVKQTDSTTASTITYIIPVVATIAAVAFLGETLTWYEPVGACVVLLGAAMTQGLLTTQRNRTSATDGPSQLDDPRV